MKLTRKLLCLLLTLALILPMFPNLARAEEVPGEAQTDRIEVPAPGEEIVEEIPEAGKTRIEIPFQVNPLYEGLYEPNPEDIPQLPEPEEIVPHAESFQSVENAAKTMRNYMKNRTETYTIYVYSTNSDYNALFLELLEKAVAHTGTGTEGDYLMWHLAGWGGEVSIAQSGAGYNYTYTYVTPYYTTAAQEQEMTTAVKNLIDSLGIRNKSNYDKVCAVYDWICANVTYDYANLEDTSYALKFSAYAALINKTAVCQGYALLFYRLMLELGVDTRFIGGDGGGPHAWNIVKVGSYYYNVDTTWDAGYTDYEYFLKSTWTFYGHYRDPEFDYWQFHMDHPMAAEDYVHGGTATRDPYINKGYCGADITNATWAMKRDGTLVIEGEGETYGFNTSSEIPYYSIWEDHITKVVVEEGITGLKNCAFYDFAALKEAEIASSVKYIGPFCFENSKALEKVTLKAGLEEIATNAFAYCEKLTTINFPNTLKTIGESAFDGCKALKISSLPEGLETLEHNAFNDCDAIRKMTIPGSLTSAGIGVFNDCNALDTVTISEGVEKVFSSMFAYCNKLSSVTLPSTLKDISGGAFTHCSSLTSIKLPQNLESIGMNAFSSCNLKTVTIPDSVTKIGSGAFINNPNMKTVKLSANLTVIDAETFKDCPLEKIEIPNSVTRIKQYAFQGAKITTLVIPEGVQRIDCFAFNECSNLTTLTLPESLEYLSGFSYCAKLKSIIIPENVKEIGAHAFQDCDELETVSIPDSVQIIGDYAFSSCWSVKELVLPEGLTEIPDYLINGCYSLKEIIIPAGVTTIGVGAFQECNFLASLTISEGVQVVGERAFKSCAALTELVLPSSVTIVGDNAFERCTGIETATLSGELYDYVFANCTSLREVVMLDTVTSMGSKIFDKCKSLETITFLGDAPRDGGVFYIGDPFSNVTATAYYPENNDTWTEQVMKSYGGTITWVGYTPECTDHTYEAVVTEPTCSEQGYTTYTCTKCGESYVGDYTDPIPHSYESVITEPTCEAQGYTTYTCSVCGDSYVGDYTDPVDHVYEDGYCKWCDEKQKDYSFSWYSGTTSLNGTIDLNIYAVIGEDLLKDPEAFVRFSYRDKIVDVPMSEALHAPTAEHPNLYRFSCPMYAKEVVEDVTIQMMLGDQVLSDPAKGEALEYGIVDYCMNRIQKSTNPAQVAMCKALLNYASAAQLALNYKTDNLANAGLSDEDKLLPEDIDVSAFKSSLTGSETGIKADSATLMYESEVSVRVYFVLEEGYDIDDFTFTIDGEVVAPQQNDYGWFVETAGIPAKHMDQMFTFCVGGITVKYGPMSYVNNKLSASNTNTVNLAKALYVYYQAAEALLG